VVDFESVIRQEVERARADVKAQADEILSQIYQEAEKLLTQPSVKGSEVTLGVKTGRLRQALKFTLTQTDDGVEIQMWFDANIAPHAKFVINGTKFIKPHPILDEAVLKVLGDDYLLRSN
jgi:hypothetical protein